MRAVCLVVLWCLSMASHAVIVSDLYRVLVPIADQSANSRQAGIQEALQLVVVKVSGQSESARSEMVQQAATNAERYVKNFRFNSDHDDVGLQLDVVFAQNLIDKLLQDAGLPIWGKSRPLVLLWQGVEDNLQRKLINQNNNIWYSRFERVMAERGIPLLWPALDLEDDSALPPERLWGLFKTDISAASGRYMTDAVMAGRLAPGRDGGWQYSGFLQHNGEWLDIQAQDDELLPVMRQVADQVAEFMSARYAVIDDGTAAGHQIIIQGVGDFRQYHELLTYLKANVAINRVQVKSIDQQDLTLELDLAADWSQVWSTLALDKRLLPMDQEFVYHWRQ